MDNRPIGVFDSGLGGLTSLPYLLEKLPQETVVYFGDTARAPYGSRDPETIKQFTFQIADFLASQEVKMMIISCNTITAVALDDLQLRYPEIPIVGIIQPAAQRVAQTTAPDEKVGVMATKVTIQSGLHADYIHELAPAIQVFGRACPVLVPLIEEGIVDDAIMDLALKHYLDDLVYGQGIRKLVLGCTHYAYLPTNLKRVYPQLELVNPSEIVIDRAAEILAERDAFAQQNDRRHLCCASLLSESFQSIVAGIFADVDSVDVRCATL